MYVSVPPRLPLPILACIVAVFAAGCSKTEPAPEPIRAVRTLTLGAASAGGTHEFAADVRARVESRLGFRVAGKLISRSAEVGQQVKAGQSLAQLDTTDLKLGQDAAAAATRSAQASFDLSAAEFKRYKELREQGFIGALEFERREAALKSQKAQLEQVQAQAQVQNNQAAYGVLLAPASGVVVGVDAEIGAVLTTGSTVVRLAHDGPRDVVFTVPEDQLPAIRALVGKPGAVRVRPWGGSSLIPATVRELAAAADPATRTYLARAGLGTASVQLGQTMTVLVDLPRSDSALKLPLTALTQQAGQTSVWVVDKTSMTVRAQTVSVAGADGNSIVVASGLQVGQIVVTAGVHTLSPGQRVKFYEVPAAPAATAAVLPSPVPATAPAASR